MLRELQIRDLAVVEAVSLELSGGFTALTGETGAGKSILVDALALALGERADAAAIRTGAERLEVSAAFSVGTLPEARAWLAERALDEADECILRRVVSADGRSRAWINGRSATVQSLRELGALLVDICGQQEYQSLRLRSSQRAVLDAQAGNGPLLAGLAAAWREARAAEERLAALRAAGRDREARRALLALRLDELEALDPRPGEFAELEQSARRLAHRRRIAEAVANALARLDDDDSAAASVALVAARRQLDGIAALDPAIAPAAALCDEAIIQVREAAAALRDHLERLDADPAGEARVADRVAAMRDLARKLQVAPGELPEVRQQLAAEAGELDNLDDSVAALEAACATARAALATEAARLTARRRAAAGAFTAAVAEQLAGLGMPAARFSIELIAQPDGTIGPSGAEEVEFRFSANPGQALGPLGRVASGGELSRLNLAIQVVAAGASPVGTLIFDEVDSGVGGAVAEIVGHRLRDLARHRQVLCITHLPQVASLADQHLTVTKSVSGARTTTTVRPLDEAARLEETARMLGGVEITARTREHAREMLGRRTSVVAGAAAEPARPGGGARRQPSRRGRT
jgi:DNA repair protein RecN (Recombination protein N)